MLPPPYGNLSTNNLPILQKLTDTYKLWHKTLPHIPRLTRYTLGERIDKCFLELVELILVAGYAKKEFKLPLVKKASTKLDVLKFLLQTAWELKTIKTKNFSEITVKLAEFGKMLGGWQKSL